MFVFHQPQAQFALAAVRRGAQLCRQIQDDRRQLRLEKADQSPVTVADFAVQGLIARMLLDFDPAARLVAEEGSAALRTPGQETVLGAVSDYLRADFPASTPETVSAWIDHGSAPPNARYWLLDPIDGTKGYVRGGQYCVALALIENYQVVLAALGCPNLDQGLQPSTGGPGALVIAGRGEGAWAAAIDADSFHRLHVSPVADPQQARLLRSAEASHTNEDQLAQLQRVLGSEEPPRRMDSMVKYAQIAAGHGELVFRLPPASQPERKENTWDHAAGLLIVEESGGRVSDLAGKKLDFSQGRLLEDNRGVLISNGHLHQAALEAVKRLGLLP